MIRNWISKTYDTVNILVGFVALYCIGYGYMFYAYFGGFVAKFLPKRKIAEKVRQKKFK